VDSLAEHRALMAAITQREPAKAASLMRRHFAAGLDATA
jgi:DNA-binding FadR family transcriptional regulator